MVEEERPIAPTLKVDIVPSPPPVMIIVRVVLTRPCSDAHHKHRKKRVETNDTRKTNMTQRPYVLQMPDMNTQEPDERQ